MAQPRHLHFFAASLLSSVLLTIGWQPVGLVFTVFAGFVPLLWIEKQLRNQGKSALWLLLYTYLAFALWNVGTTWWIWNASPEGALMAFVLNSLLMCVPVLLYHRLSYRMNEKDAQRALIFLWTGFEFAHYNWEGTWPWLSLGNVFSSLPAVVQWYEYTGVLGGTVWVLIVNLRLFRYLENWPERSITMRYSKGLNLIFFYVFAPVFFSLFIANQLHISGKNLNVVVVQPNIDPYKDKFAGMSPDEQTRKMIALAEQQTDSTTGLVCFPETALVGSLDEDRLDHNSSVSYMKEFLAHHPHLAVLTGADTYRFYPDQAKRSVTARLYEGDLYYDSYNTALLLDQNNRTDQYHKSKLVPGVERLPYAAMFGFIKKLTVDLGGTSGSLGSDSTSKVFRIRQGNEDRAVIAPVICYESVFGEYLGSYVQKGANLICIITNDGWWGNTPGYKQHFDYARLRAIETRRYVARSANTGISGFIDPQGNIMEQSTWWTESALKATLILNDKETIYSRYGDYLGLAALWLSLVYLIMYRRRLS